jgi:hypothetical protein
MLCGYDIQNFFSYALSFNCCYSVVCVCISLISCPINQINIEKEQQQVHQTGIHARGEETGLRRDGNDALSTIQESRTQHVML